MSNMSQQRMRHCFVCGNPLGPYPDCEPFDTCGWFQCEREARYAYEAERREAHEQLDRDRGWS